MRAYSRVFFHLEVPVEAIAVRWVLIRRANVVSMWPVRLAIAALILAKLFGFVASTTLRAIMINQWR
jgi:hypothetical protein